MEGSGHGVDKSGLRCNVGLRVQGGPMSREAGGDRDSYPVPPPRKMPRSSVSIGVPAQRKNSTPRPASSATAASTRRRSLEPVESEIDDRLSCVLGDDVRTATQSPEIGRAHV